MELSKITAGVIMVCVAVLVCAVVLVPVVDDVTATERTFKNEGYFTLDKYEATDELAFKWDHATPSVFEVNGEQIEYTNTSSLAQSVVLGEKFAIRLAPNNVSITFYGNGTYITADSTNTTITATFTEGSITVTNGVTTKVVAGSPIYAIAESGAYVMKKADSIAYLNSNSEVVADSEIYGSGQTYSGNNNIFWHIEGTVDNLEYPDTFNSAIVVSNEAINGEYAGGYTDLYELSNITFTATVGAVVYNITASYFVVPSEVTASVKDPMSSENSIILSIVPILMFVGVVLVTVRLMAGRSD